MTCKSGWYEQVFYESGGFSSLVPSKLIDCQTSGSDDDDSDEYFAEVRKIVAITMFMGLLFLVLAMYRSCSKTRTDWYRLIAIYVVGTIGVPISIQLGPSEGGFNRIIGFGILVHNFAEVCILGHIWRGAPQVRKAHNANGTMWVIMYVWLIMVLIAFLPPVALFPVLMAQGAFCDWTLVTTFVFLGRWMDSDKNGGKAHREKMGCYGKLGTAAAITHILSIEPLFFGIATTWSTLNAITVVCLMPTFILYIWFSSADQQRRPIIISPDPSSNNWLNKKRNDLLIEMVHGHGGDQAIELKQRRAEMDHTTASSEQKEDANRASAAKEDATCEKSMTYGEVIRVGLVNIDDANRKSGVWVALIGFAISFSNVIFIYFTPCMVDMRSIVCD